MKEIELPLIGILLAFYIFYIEGGDEAELKERAEDIYNHFLTVEPLVSEVVLAGLGPLIDFYVNTGVPRLSKEQALRIIEELKWRQRELTSL